MQKTEIPWSHTKCKWKGQLFKRPNFPSACAKPFFFRMQALDPDVVPAKKKTKRTHVPEVLKDWFLEYDEEMRKQKGGGKTWPMTNTLSDAQRLCPEWFGGIDPNTPRRWTHSLHKVKHRLGRPTLLSPAHITILSALVTAFQQGVHVCEMGLDAKPGVSWVKEKKMELVDNLFLKVCTTFPRPESPTSTKRTCECFRFSSAVGAAKVTRCRKSRATSRTAPPSRWP